MDYADIPEKGNCFPAAFHLAEEHIRSCPDIEPLLRIVHAEVDCQHREDVPAHGHAYVTIEHPHLDPRFPKLATAHDSSLGREIVMPLQVYEDIGNIGEINNKHVYTYEEVLKNLLKHGHYGPWDLETSTGL